jgi:hypothetical protein
MKKTRSRKSCDTVPLSYAFPRLYSFLSYKYFFTPSSNFCDLFFYELLLLSSEFLSLVKNKFLFSAVRKSSFNLLKVGQGNFPSLPPSPC